MTWVFLAPSEDGNSICFGKTVISWVWAGHVETQLNPVSRDERSTHSDQLGVGGHMETRWKDEPIQWESSPQDSSQHPLCYMLVTNRHKHFTDVQLLQAGNFNLPPEMCVVVWRNGSVRDSESRGPGFES
ncbi:hypothetical protein Bbelb_228990 [Branchiostoma belcheri]|nr:hypothetical protein Bbelb_228990 [Branchiostoma belcheri]